MNCEVTAREKTGRGIGNHCQKAFVSVPDSKYRTENIAEIVAAIAYSEREIAEAVKELKAD